MFSSFFHFPSPLSLYFCRFLYVINLSYHSNHLSCISFWLSHFPLDSDHFYPSLHKFLSSFGFIWRHLGVKMNSKWLFNSTIVFPVLNIIYFKYSYVQNDLFLVSKYPIWRYSEIRHFRYLLTSISGYWVQCVWVFLHFCVD